MSQRALLIVAAGMLPLSVTALGGGCGTTITITNPGTGGRGEGGEYRFLTGGNGGTDDPDADLPDGDLPDYDDPGCPDKPPPIEDFQCDPYAQNNGDCLPEEGCFIFVDYPSQPCGQEVYGSACLPEGTGQQGSSCGGALDCAGGFVCVISGSGTQCIQLCSLSGNSGCPPGLVCEPIDVVGFGGCL
ncbi:MAG: hypothetical protein R3B72_13670 [Polyangiaceae bacterium]